jgi:hypothetical protein
MLRPSLLLLSILIALARAKGRPLRLYLSAELLTTLGIELAFQLCHQDVEAFGYKLTFALLRPWNLAAALNIGRPRWASGIIAIGTAWLVYLALPGPPTVNSAIAIVQGAVFMLAATSLIFTVPFMLLDQMVYATLLALWVMLAVFSYGYAVGWELPKWHSLNLWFPTFACVGLFLLLAGFSHQHAPKSRTFYFH